MPYTLTANNALNDIFERQAPPQVVFSPNNMTTTLNNMMMMTSTVTSGDINPLHRLGTLDLTRAQP